MDRARPAEPGPLELIPARDGLPPRERFVIREEIVSAAGLRLEVGGEHVGVLFLNFRTQQRFDPAKRQMVETFAGQVALAIQIARLYRNIKEIASREESAYLAQELHDAVLQALFSEVLCGTTNVKDCLSQGDRRAAEEHLCMIGKAATYCVEQCYGIMDLLKDRIVDDLGLFGAIRYFWQEVLAQRTLPLALPQTEGSLPIMLKRHLYRIAQAALGNVVRWAQATQVAVRLEDIPDQVTFEIRDNGRGFDPQRVAQERGHYGLLGIQKRAKSFRGRVEIDSRPGGPTALRVLIPVQGGSHGEISSQAG